MEFDGLKVFSATKHNEREVLGERITNWLLKNPNLKPVDKIITQSSDNEFHCLTITIFFKGVVEWNPDPVYTRTDQRPPNQMRR